MTQPTLSETLAAHSRRVILEHQQPGGAYLAGPLMPDYQFSWFRDGAFIAYALELDGEAAPIAYGGSAAAQWESAQSFHDWCVRVINQRTEKLELAIAQVEVGLPVNPQDALNARYDAQGEVGPDSWPEFQLDGPGAWLWSLAEFADRFRLRPLPLEWAQAVRLTARYLAALWRQPCYDCWEEFPDQVHTSTLAAIYGGLRAAERLVPPLDFSATTDAIRAFVLDHGLTPSGELAKWAGGDMVDANLIAAATPFRLLEPDDPIMDRTIERIERELHAPDSGVHRYLKDVYYGGGAWVLLALWLAWHYAERGLTDRAAALIAWAERQADHAGDLPEQVTPPMLAAEHYQPWIAQRGPIARPLLWSHAQHLIARYALASAGDPRPRAQNVSGTS